MGLGLYTTVSSRVVPGTGAPGCAGVRLHAVGRRTHVLGARSVHHPVSSPSSVRSGRCLESRVTPPSATRILPSGLSPSVPGFHRLSRRTHGRFKRVWCERVADCDRRLDFHRPRSTLLPVRIQRWSLCGHCRCGDRRSGPPQRQSTSQGEMMIEAAGRRCYPAMPVRPRQRRRTPRRSPSRADSSEIRPRPQPGCQGIRARSRRGRRRRPGHRRRSPRS